MADRPFRLHKGIPLYIRQIEKQSVPWLQWQRGRVRYGLPIIDIEEAIGKAQMMIDAMLHLEGI